jgi:hypothetical protein
MLKLLIRNKIVEMANGIHYLWTDGDLVFKYLAVMLLSLPFGVFGWYNLIMYTSPKITESFAFVIFVSVMYHISFLVFSGIVHVATVKFIGFYRKKTTGSLVQWMNCEKI